MIGVVASATTNASAVVSFLYWPVFGAFCFLVVCVAADRVLASRERRDRVAFKQFMRGTR